MYHRIFSRKCLLLGLLLPFALHAQQDSQQLRERIARLEAELHAARAELATIEGSVSHQERTLEAEGSTLAEPAVEGDPDAPADGIRIGNFRIGGAIRANWILGDYNTGSSGPSRGGHGGDFVLDTFRVNVDYADDTPLSGSAEYRWYSGYNFFHTLELAYELDEASTLKGGLTRVPFGVGPYGPANSWFFDQHYYVGLADDMDVGLVYTRELEGWTLDFGLFAASPPQGRGSSKVGSRYSFDLVDARNDPTYFGNRTPTGYRERGQANLRLVRHLEELALPTDLGISLQYGRLDGRGTFSNANPWAVSIHSRSTQGPWTLMLQATRYDYDSAEDHITGGFYDYTTDIASKGTILSAALSYTWVTPVDWLDSITFYNDYSVIRKHATGFNDSAMNILGAAFARGGWYIYADWAYSNGNEFVGDFRPGMWADNVGRTWQSRLNINFGYYY